ncbi:MAG TPA: rhomboid family intramembrane serine protease [Kofleriaceae bacterium]
MALVAVAVGAGYWGQHFLRTRPHGTPTFGIMLLGAAVLCAAGMYGRHGGGDALSLAGAIGVGTGTCLLVVGPFLQSIARRLAQADRVGAAMKLFALADIIAPGAGAGDEKAMLRAMLDIRAGKIEPTIAALSGAKPHAPPEAQRAIDERIVMLYLAAHRWREGIAHAEANLALDPVDPLQLGAADPVWVELLGAYGREGDITRAGSMAARVEVALADEPRAAIWRHRARLAFLALAGRVEAVKQLVARAASPHMSAQARTYWLAVAHDRHGEHLAARTLYEKARAQSKGRGKDLVGDALEKLPAADGAPVALDEATAAIADRLAAAPVPVPLRMRGRVWAMPLLVGTSVAAFATVRLILGEPGDLAVLARTGGAMREFVSHGEWWRLVSSVFLHAGIWHLALDVVGLWFLGRLAEVVFGGWRVLAIFAVAAVAGTTASYFATGGTPIGAGGGVFGLLGALFVEISTNRTRYRNLANRGLWMALAIIIVVQLGWDLLSTSGGPWLNGGGLVAGCAVGAVLSPHRKGTLWIARGIGAAFLTVTALSVLLVARTSLADSLGTATQPTLLDSHVVAMVPPDWFHGLTRNVQPDELVELRATVVTDDPAKWLTAQTLGLRAMATSSTDEKDVVIGETPDSDDIDWEQHAAPELLVPAPGWTSQELLASYDTALGARQHLRVVLAWRRFGATTVGVRLITFELVAREAGAFLGSLLPTGTDP